MEPQLRLGARSYAALPLISSWYYMVPVHVFIHRSRSTAALTFPPPSFPQLFNTAVTRAREWLIVVGEPITLCTVGSNRLCWLEFIRKCNQLGSFGYPNAQHFESFLETRLIAR